MPKALTLAKLLAPWLTMPELEGVNPIIENLELDSRKVSQGVTFVAIRGHAIDGRRFIETAICQGANAVIAQACDKYSHGEIVFIHQVPVVYMADLAERLSALALRLCPLKNNKLIAVTGTNGKTTITQLIAQWLNLVEYKSAVMGTTGNGFLENLQSAKNTTGSAIDIVQTLHHLEQQGADFTALEVSSHGLVQGRVKALTFEVGAFSNLSRDHLDYHGSMEEYAHAKFALFTQHICKQAVLNIDDPVGQEWFERLDSAIAITLKPCQHPRAVYVSKVSYSESGITLEFDGLFGQGRLCAPLIGEFNASNLLMAMTCLLALGIDKQRLIETAGQLTPVIGRMELFVNTSQEQNTPQAKSDKAKVVVDYAHTPDALEKALQALRVHCQGRLFAIFGCGGDRDKGKRPMMARIGEQLADTVILTDDNPRSESPVAIVQDMLAGMENPELALVKHDRFAALQWALANSQPDDIILLAGKGHEDYQVMADQTIHYSDRESALQLLEINE